MRACQIHALDALAVQDTQLDLFLVDRIASGFRKYKRPVCFVRNTHPPRCWPPWQSKLSLGVAKLANNMVRAAQAASYKTADPRSPC